MATADYTHGEMNINEQQRTFDTFMKASFWGACAIVLSVGYMTFTLALGMHWLIALVLCAGAGIVGGVIFGMGAGWIAAVLGLTALAVIVQVSIIVIGWLI